MKQPHSKYTITPCMATVLARIILGRLKEGTIALKLRKMEENEGS
jgi:hypothetical protein